MGPNLAHIQSDCLSSSLSVKLTGSLCERALGFLDPGASESARTPVLFVSALWVPLVLHQIFLWLRIVEILKRWRDSCWGFRVHWELFQKLALSTLCLIVWLPGHVWTSAYLQPGVLPRSRGWNHYSGPRVPLGVALQIPIRTLTEQSRS